MVKVNAKAKDYRKDTENRLAGGYGVYAANQSAEGLLRRAVMSCLLWEDLAYESGVDNANNIAKLIPLVKPETVYQIALEARLNQKLRHVPLYIARIMAKLPDHKRYVGELLPQIITRADQLTDFLAIYWKDGKQPLSKQVKLGLAKAFENFNEYQLAKYNRDNEIKLRDVLFMVHAKPKDKAQEDLWRRLVSGELETPDTWEVELSQSRDKKASWERLLREGKLGALAFLRNLRNIEQAEVDRGLVVEYFNKVNPQWLLPINYMAAAKYAPRYEQELEALMLKGLEQSPKLKGYTVFVVDVSGSMNHRVSEKSEFSRLDVAKSMAILASSMCERIAIYVTAGSDYTRIHQTEMLKPRRGFALGEAIDYSKDRLGGGGIFTRQCLEYIKKRERCVPDRIIIFSDSQDCDLPGKQTPNPFGKHNYIVDVSAHSRGINYDGLWTAEVSGWSEHFLNFIAALEGESLQETE